MPLNTNQTNKQTKYERAADSLCGLVVKLVYMAVGWLLMQVLDNYNRLLAELQTHRDWIHGAESSLAVVRKTPLAEDVDSLQQQVTSVQVCSKCLGKQTTLVSDSITCTVVFCVASYCK